MNQTKCNCIIHHPITTTEREQVAKALEYARTVGDSTGIMITLMQLTQPCPAVKGQTK